MAGSELPAIRLCSGQKTIIVVYKYGNRSTTPDYEDVPSSVELRWRPDDHQATFTVSS
jgi:hypothetical protein